MSTQGTATIDFGAFPGGTDASVVVTGQAGILSGSLIEAWLRPIATADHSIDEHYMAAAMMDVIAGEIVAGTGFTIRAVARDLGSQKLLVPARGNQPLANFSYQPEPAVSANVGGQDLNMIWGQFTVAWVWN